MSMTILCDVDNHKFYSLCGHLEWLVSRLHQRLYTYSDDRNFFSYYCDPGSVYLTSRITFMEYYLLSHPSREIYDQASKWIVPSTTGYLAEFRLGIWSRHYLSAGKSSVVLARPWYEEHTGYDVAHCVGPSTLVSIFCYWYTLLSNCYYRKWGPHPWSKLWYLERRQWRPHRSWRTIWVRPSRIKGRPIQLAVRSRLRESGTTCTRVQHLQEVANFFQFNGECSLPILRGDVQWFSK